VCDGRGVECAKSEPDTSGTAVSESSDIYCYSCSRPIAIVCLPAGSADYNNVNASDVCIPCGAEDLSCIIRDWRIMKDFDYLAAFSTNDDIKDYQISGMEPFIFTNDFLVYKI